MTEYTATIERNLLGDREWFIRVRYAIEQPNGKAKNIRFNLVPQHQGMMFSEACEDIERAIERHRAGVRVLV